METKKPRIIFRADGDSRIGLGHVFRSLGLIEYLRKDYYCVFAIVSPQPEIESLLSQKCDFLVVLPENTKEAESFFLNCIHNKDIVVLDGYHFVSAFQEKVSLRCFKLVVVDDLISGFYFGDVIINPSGGIDNDSYTTKPGCKIFSGIEYSILRMAFLTKSGSRFLGKKSSHKKGEVFLSFGGADPGNMTLRVLNQAILIEEFSEFHVVVGSAYVHFESLLHEAAKLPKKVNIYKGLEADEMAELMEMVEYGICSSSTIAYEFLCCNHQLFVVLTAENQKNAFRFLVDEHCACEWHGKDSLLIAKFDFCSIIKYFDGNQNARIVKIFNDLK